MWSAARSSAHRWDPTRNEADFLAHIRSTIESDPSITQWHVVVDNLNTHCSESLVRYVAEVSGTTDDLGTKDKCGVLRSMATRAAFLTNRSHKVVFHYTPKHASWLNQVETLAEHPRPQGVAARYLQLWFDKPVWPTSIWATQRYQTHSSTDDLRTKVLEFIAYFNRTMAKPLQWTYLGKPLHA
jgi:hypothetical protein